jgi:predicted transcriptional regulator
MPDEQTLIELTADIVAAHVSNNKVSIGDVPALLANVHAALTGLGKAPEPTVPKKTPAVSLRASIKPDHIVCLECGAKQRMLKRHLQTAHGMTPEQYRSDFELPKTYPMAAPDYVQQRAELAKKIGLGRMPRKKGASDGAANAEGKVLDQTKHRTRPKKA